VAGNLARHRTLASGVVLRQSGKASLVASVAVFTSSLVDIGTFAMVFYVAGFMISKT